MDGELISKGKNYVQPSVQPCNVEKVGRKEDTRGRMPQTAVFIDECREAFGAAEVNAAIRAAMKGEPLFHAVENGHELGTPMVEADPTRVVTGDALLPWGLVERKGNDDG